MDTANGFHPNNKNKVDLGAKTFRAPDSVPAFRSATSSGREVTDPERGVSPSVAAPDVDNAGVPPTRTVPARFLTGPTVDDDSERATTCYGPIHAWERGFTFSVLHLPDERPVGIGQPGELLDILASSGQGRTLPCRRLVVAPTVFEVGSREVDSEFAVDPGERWTMRRTENSGCDHNAIEHGGVATWWRDGQATWWRAGVWSVTS